jgi:glycosyltransferase involved in cell wall biosynthesis
VTCYKHPDYVRALALRAALTAGSDFDDVVTVKNSSTGALRYAQVTWALLRQRFRSRPDAYLVTFRGYEILPIVLLIAGRRPVVYDEFINPVEWFVEEHRKFAPGSLPAKALRGVMRSFMKRTRRILADTPSHLVHSAQLMDLEQSRYRTVVVGTDEQTFRSIPPRTATGEFVVLYYGSMLPLHGLDFVLDAAVALRDSPVITFRFIGGDETDRCKVEAAAAAGASVRYQNWVDYAELPGVFAECDLFLGGPFGATVQSRYVITGKTYQFLAAGLPVMIGANEESEVFTHRTDALIVDQGDAAAIARETEWAAANREQLNEIGERGRALYDDHFSSAVVQRQLKGVFEPVTGPLASEPTISSEGGPR